MTFHALVVEDTEDAIGWYESQSPTASVNFKLAVKKALDNILRTPLTYRKVLHEIRIYHIKNFPFIIYYLVIKDTVYVVSIFHTSRNPDVWKKRLDDI